MSPSTANSNNYAVTAHSSGYEIPLSFMKNNEGGEIVRISGSESVRKHLAELGFLPGTMVLTVSSASGNVIVDVRGSKVAVDAKIASKIICCPVS